jgi:phosphoribosylformylglycinamidine synthase II
VFYRVEVSPKVAGDDPAAAGFLRGLELALPELRSSVESASYSDVYWVELSDALAKDQVEAALREVFWDSVLQKISWSGSQEEAPWALERRFRAGVTDNVGKTSEEALRIVLGSGVVRAASGGLLKLRLRTAWDSATWKRVAETVYCNPLIESWKLWDAKALRGGDRFEGSSVLADWPRPKAGAAEAAASSVEKVRLSGLSDSELEALSTRRLWALNLEEMRAIRDHFGRLGRDPSDVEMEILAQTWSEHCKHKIFGAQVEYSDKSGNPRGAEIPAQINSLFKTTIAATTREMPRPWLLSVFSDNAGIVAMDADTAVCIKVETHNSPSALDPYGGALTGIVGVNRDILGCGLGAKPIFNTDVFCTAEIDYREELPERLMHPRRILEGVRKGVEHGGNKSGIPTVNGALCFDERYLGKPLVYCGTGGVMPRTIAGRPCESKDIHSGDRIVMVGGRVGKDGIHGATFSSLALDETSPVTAVQLGDPITQKRMSDFLLEARDLGLYRALTDNGAGGLSSSVGEMAGLAGGARLDVGLAPTKYPGLLPYELVISESQERMTVAVPPEKLQAFLELARRRGAEATDLGEFEKSGKFHVQVRGETVAELDLSFLHDGCPKLKLRAEWSEPLSDAAGRAPQGEADRLFRTEARDALLDLLSRPNIASKEWMIRQYDHEVQGQSVVKPLHQVRVGSERRSGPNDAGVVRLREGSQVGVAVGCGILPNLGDVDPYLMAQAVVDEAVRNIIAVGAEYGTTESVISLCDNYCWPDPVKDPRKMAALVRACFGMRQACVELGVPLVSGKDSMKNDYRGKLGGRDVHISVPFTLLMTAVGRVADIRRARTADFQHPNEAIFLLGPSVRGLRGSEWERTQTALRLQSIARRTVDPRWSVARKIYSWLGGTLGKEQGRLRAVHDVSEGGLYTALVEMALARGLGVHVNSAPDHGDAIWEWAFGEGFHSFVVSCAESDSDALQAEWKKLEVPFERIGRTATDDRFRDGLIDLSIEECRQAWMREGYWQ